MTRFYAVLLSLLAYIALSDLTTSLPPSPAAHPHELQRHQPQRPPL